MYLIRLKISGKDLPAILPPSLIPPSLRQPVPSAQVQPPPVQQPQFTSATLDLFGLDDAFGSPAPGSPATAFTAGVQSPPRTLTPQKATSPKPTSPVLSTPLLRQFQPQSDFGKGIATPPLQSSIPVQSTSPPQPSFKQLQMTAPVQVPMQSGSVFGDQDRDLLGDADPEVSQKLTAETAELANLSNQIGSLNTATRDLQSNKARAETELANVSQQKRDIEARLKQIRSLYDAEVNSVKAVETQLSIVRGEFVKNKQELTILEASLHALQTQLAEQKGMLQKDQAENNSLKTRIASVGEEIKQLKETLEKVKRDARQQRGMVAINKKQLSTIEGERDKIQTEIDGEKKALETMQAEAAQQQAVQRDVVSPVSSERSMGTNPFLRMQSTGDASSATNYLPHHQTFSPPAQTFSPFHERSFDSAFEDAFPTQHSNVASPEPVSPPFPATQKPEPMAVQQTGESTLDQRSPPSIASALSPPLAARDSPTYAESATSSLAVNAPRSGVGSVNGDTSPGRISAEITPKEEKNIPAVSKVLSTLAAVTTLPTQEGPVVPDVQETEVKGSDEKVESPQPIHVDTKVVDQVSHAHGPRSAGAITSADMVQQTLSHRPRDEDLAIPSLEQTPRDAAPTYEEKVEEKGEDEGKGVSPPGAFPSEGSEEGRESWVDLGDESKSLPSDHQPTLSSLPSNRSDPFAFSVSSGPPKVATKEDFDAAFSSFGSLGNKDNEGFTKDFNTEFPPIEEYGDDDSDSEASETAGFNDNFATKGKENGLPAIGTSGKIIETPSQQTLPTSPPVETTIKSPPPATLPHVTAPSIDIPPPVPPKESLSEGSSAPPITPSPTPPPKDTGLNPPAYSEYSNQAEMSSGSNDLSGLVPRRGEPHSSAAPYTSPPQSEGFHANVIRTGPTSFVFYATIGTKTI